MSLAVLLASTAGAQDPSPPAPPPPEAAPPCADPVLRCPDLIAGRPDQLRIVSTRTGRRLLASRNRIINRGDGPLFLTGERTGARTMRVSQRLYRTGRGFRAFPLDAARFDFWLIPGQGRYWKLRDALRFELWTAGGGAARQVRTGKKTRFCMRDLREARGLAGPRRRVFPACSQSDRARRVRMGISAGWVESYPAGYHEQYVDVTGLRGCFSLRHVADPLGLLLESDDANNTARTVLRLPRRPGRVRGAGRC